MPVNSNFSSYTLDGEPNSCKNEKILIFFVKAPVNTFVVVKE